MTKKAFLVGINDYSPAGPGGEDLGGCINDVRDMLDTLVICGFTSKNIGIRTNSRATKKGIMGGLDWLVSNSKKGDSLVFYYSGHGSQVSDSNLNGDEKEHDGKDEILCPHDLDWTSKTILRDDDLRNIFNKLPGGVNLEVILDCCHSGTGTRDFRPPKSMLPERDDTQNNDSTRIRFLPPPLDVSSRIQYEPELSTKWLFGLEPENKSAKVEKGLNHTLWAGCKDSQTSKELRIDSNQRGVFTHSFCKILRKTNGQITRINLYRLLSAAVRKYDVDQTPQLEVTNDELKDRPFV
jgi:hypothetical protein